MSKIAKTALLSAITLFVFGFAISTYAAKPDTDQIISYGPIVGDSFLCLVRNLSEEPLEITGNFVNFNGGSATGFPSKLEVGAGYSLAFENNLGSEIVDCVVSWKGQKGDVRATLCAFAELNSNDSIGCFELN